MMPRPRPRPMARGRAGCVRTVGMSALSRAWWPSLRPRGASRQVWPIDPARSTLLIRGARPDMIKLGECTYVDAARLARDPRSVILLPLGAVEEHGPHLPLLVD